MTRAILLAAALLAGCACDVPRDLDVIERQAEDLAAAASVAAVRSLTADERELIRDAAGNLVRHVRAVRAAGE